MRVLHLTLKKKWFDMIASGEKKEEYRQIKKYWIDRLKPVNMVERNKKNELIDMGVLFTTFDVVRFRNGYSKNAPTLDIQFEGITIGPGREKWGGGYKDCFVIKLGELLTAKQK